MWTLAERRQEVRRCGFPTKEDSTVVFTRGLLGWIENRGGVRVRFHAPFQTAVVGEVQICVQVKVKRSAGKVCRDAESEKFGDVVGS